MVATASLATIIELLGDQGDPVRYTVADGTAISKGTLLKVADPRTASASTGAADKFAGIAAADKVASDGSTTLAAYTFGIFDIYSVPTQAITAGVLVSTSEAQVIKPAAATDVENGAIVGKALESAAADTAEKIAVLVHV